MRLDLYLVQNKLASSRTQAQDFIENGFVFLINNEIKQKLIKSNYLVKETDRILVEANDLQRYVSRAGLKLESALKHLKLNVSNKIALDVGQSTGGFTDCLLKADIQRVVGIDVGHSQLHEKLKNHKQVISFENLNAKDLALDQEFLKSAPADKFDFLVADVSFISLLKIVPSIANLLRSNGEYLLLVKPQFECGREFLDKNGLVNDAQIYNTVEQSIRHMALFEFKNVEAYFPCEVLGKDGNQEFFIYGKQKN